MKKIITIISILGITIGIAYAQSLTPQQMTDLQGQLSDDQKSLSDEQSSVTLDNQDMNKRLNRIDSLTNRINDAESVIAYQEQLNQQTGSPTGNPGNETDTQGTVNEISGN